MKVVESKNENVNLRDFAAAAGQVILGKTKQIELALCALVADGHILLEDVPGVGKTTMVKTFAALLGLKTSRIQFTNDLLPADILGTSIFSPEKQKFHFHAGPIFGQVIIADELNRATPKTQSALLQAMEERRVSIDGMTHELPKPFFVVATQNPKEQMGTYALPESQMDRFMMRIDIGFPDRKAELDLLKGERRELMLERLAPVAKNDDLLNWQKMASEVHVSEPLLRYLQDLLEYTRLRPKEMQGLSPRAGLVWLRAAKAWACLQDRKMVLPEDLQAVGVAVMSHRLPLSRGSSHLSGSQIAEQVLNSVKVD